MEYEVEGSRPRGRPKRTWKEVFREDCQARKLNKADAVDHYKWRKVIKEVHWSGWVWAGECFFWYWPTWVVLDKRPLNGCCCRCCWYLHCFETVDQATGSASGLFLKLIWCCLSHMNWVKSCKDCHVDSPINIDICVIIVISITGICDAH